MFFKLTPEEIEKAFQDKNVPGPYDDKYVSLVNINKVYDNKFHAVYDFNIDIKKKEFIVFVGPSGCGKSTTLRMIAGLEDISSGDLFINGERCNDLLSKDRDVAMVFQNYALYPNMTVYKNMAFALKVRHFPKDLIDKRVKEAAKILEIEDQLKKKPKELSGGQRQRVALGRAIVRNARIFLMDEPLSNLDAKLRVQMRAEIIRLHKKLNATTIYVTHDQTEAMTMADRIVVMKLGVVQQIDTPIEIYRHPANKFVASFIGSPSMNFLTGTYDHGLVIFQNKEKIKLTAEQMKKHDLFYKSLHAKESTKLNEFYQQLELEKEAFDKKHNSDKVKNEFYEKYNKLKEDKQKLMEELKRINKGLPHKIIFGIRPEAITQVKAKKGNNDNIIVREVKLSELLGDEYFLHFDYSGQDLLSKIISEKLITAGTKIALQINKEKIHLFDVNTEVTIC